MKLKPKDLAPFTNKALEISKLTDKELEMFREFYFLSDGQWKFNNPSGHTIILFSDILKSLKIIQKKLK